MSSLSEQLAQISTSNATVAFDRKRRQKLHSASLIYNPKTASTQDYESIFENATKALNELSEIDPRFEIFKRSLFSESSISIDRNVQSKDEVNSLNNAINAYLYLASSKWHLSPTLHATEWLVRRFQIHVLNAETFLLSTLNYYQTPVFNRILNIIKLPPLFQPLSNFVRKENLPTNLTIIKLFNDIGFLKLYASYLSKNIKQKTTYTNQLLFVTCCFINLIAFNSNNEDKLNQMVPIFLEISAKLLSSNSVDCQIAAHTILVVLSTALPLQKVIINAAMETILSNLKDIKAKKSAFIAICKMFQTLKGQGNIDQLSDKLYKLFDSCFDSHYLTTFLSDNEEGTLICDKFITSYIRAIARYDHSKLSNIVNILEKVKLEKFEVRMLIIDLIHLSEILDDKSQLIQLFEYFIKINEKLVINCLKSLNLTPELFEIRLTTSLFTLNEINDENVKNLDSQKIAGQNTQVPPFKEFLEKNSSYINTKNTSMVAESDETFNKSLSLFIEAVGRSYQPGLFLSSFFTTLEGRMTFLLRTVISPAAPITLRIIALTNISKYLHNIDKESNLFTLVPILLVALNDVSKNVRLQVKKVLIQISKRPSTKHYFLVNKIYGSDVALQMLSPKDGENWLNKFIDEYIVENTEMSHIFIPKKNEKVFLLFWANQALNIPLPYAKAILLDNLSKHSSANAYSTLFQNFFENYLNNRSEWEIKCKNNKTDFSNFETKLIDLISEKEKNQFLIDFSIQCLKSDHEQLSELVAARILKIFSTLKSAFQLQIVENIINSAAESDPVYDAIGLLQALPVSADIFNSILSANKINTDASATDLTKRRRRRSSSNKSAFQNEEVSQLAEVHLRKLTIILEALDKAKVEGTSSLLSTLFSLLSDLESLDQDGGLPVLYVQETLTSCMLNVLHSLKENGTTELDNVRADILVSAIRNSPSPQLQNKFLLVVGALASLSSETVLHSVMPIFTFMGAHSIRQDDSFTTQVVEKTILTVVPALLENANQTKQDELEFLLMSFTTAFQHVPKHRRVRLYSTLVKTLGASTAIGPFFFLVAQQFSAHMATFKLGEARNFIEFAKLFLVNFTVSEQLTGLRSFLQILSDLLKSIKDKETKDHLSSKALFTNGVLNSSVSELFVLVQNSFDFINKVIQEDDADYYNVNGSFKLRVYAALLDSNNDKKYLATVKEEFGSVLEYVLLFINNSGDNFSLPDESSAEALSPDFQSEIKNLLFNLLTNTLNMLPIEDFVSSVTPLITKSANKDIRYHLALVVGTKFELESLESAPVAGSVIELLLERVPIEKSSISVASVFMNTLATLIGKFGKKLEVSLLTKSIILATNELLSDETEMVISSLTVITNCIQNLGVKAISFYPKIVPPSIKIFEKLRENKENELKEQLQLSIILLFAAMIKSIPTFLMSNLANVIYIILFSDEVETSTRLSVIDLLVTNIDLKELLKVLQKLWVSTVCKTEDSIAISLFLSILESTVEAIDKKSATSQSPTFFKLLLSLFEYRSISEFDNNTISRIEASVHKIANAYVLKMNDKVFRPLFVLTVRWAFDGEGAVNVGISEVERLTAFFKFFNKLQENLRGIITSYYTYLLEPTTKLLKRYLDKEINDINLQRLVLNSLTSSFKFDKDEYWKSTSRFEIICEVLVGQLKVVENTIGKYLVKAIGFLAANNSSVDEHNQTLNKILASHMKATCPSFEKLWAIRSMKLIYSKVGESWLVLLPQLVPVIAELLEDDDEEVEHEVRTGLVKVVENVLGEPFDRYLD
ncbi:hypothetical protein KAFR_0A01320 [Kazachstania africana CBS 2517]|uniref:U3 small nucleolar RNA-associated protein 10 n=1 Tax=Kazachstania africana (strain ATCC 22294 / BCRC 22015 / CBS 2517 / CECT 1963 / NBRC 1671 / NRRL Y-8276) TaxID=1071382 RepID=H2AMH0_KAZAF|nr:hypothetical protein KAFR_0A01320 [Kazachstania africana CBS 2517]CCF55570.1 hypothetical protein KAFR_0A01320 [Kazachstania africana CBS 2517]